MPKPPPRLRTGIVAAGEQVGMQLDDARRRTPGSRRCRRSASRCGSAGREAQAAHLADARDDGRGLGEREAELLVLVRGREEVVGLGVHAAVDAHEHGLRRRRRVRRSPRACRVSTAAVDHDRADADRHRVLELDDALVVAVEAEPRGVGPRGERDGELAARADIDGEALGGDPAHDLGAQERLAGVVDARLHAVRQRRPRGMPRACGARARAPRPRRRTYSGVPNSWRSCDVETPAIHRTPSLVTTSGCRPHALGERIRIGRRQEPIRGERSGGGQLGPIVERVLRRDCCGRGLGGARVPRQRCTHAPGGSQKSRARHMPHSASMTRRIPRSVEAELLTRTPRPPGGRGR